MLGTREWDLNSLTGSSITAVSCHDVPMGWEFEPITDTIISYEIMLAERMQALSNPPKAFVFLWERLGPRRR